MDNKFEILEQADDCVSTHCDEVDGEGWYKTIKNIPHPIQTMVKLIHLLHDLQV